MLGGPGPRHRTSSSELEKGAHVALGRQDHPELGAGRRASEPTTLGMVVELLDGYLRVHTSLRSLEVVVDDVAIYHPGEKTLVGPGSIVVGIGIGAEGDSPRAALRALEHAGARAVVIRDGDVTDRLVQDAAEAGVALLSASTVTTWARVVVTLSAALAQASLGTPPPPGPYEPSPGSLFDAANLVADLIGAPVTFEDPHGRVLAFSRQRGQIDVPRTTTILHGQMPLDHMQLMRERGVYEQLQTGEPVHVEPTVTGQSHRMAIAVRIGEEVLGCIWAVIDAPQTPSQEQSLRDAVGFVALHWFRHRLQADLRARHDAELVAALVRGGTEGRAAARKGHLPGGRYRALAVAVDPADRELTEKSRAAYADMLALHLTSHRRRAVVGLVDSTVVAVVPARTPEAPSQEHIKRVLQRVVERTGGDPGLDVRIGVGPIAESIEELPGSYVAAVQVLTALLGSGQPGAIAELADVWSSVFLSRMAENMAAEPSLRLGPLPALLECDAKHGTKHVPTLWAYLVNFGDVRVAAEQLGVHPNSVRYRIAQARNVVHLGLDDPIERLALMVQFRALGHG